ncbi:uncharacterized protein LOC117115752 [Anneissia japonica]|uniref:uncharacterized protein LOC117115752 n=1 Tax=Anneissia japonica TaxID=1529436 RepID=UPI0014256877|nr:uncharacterized protein LOC117115752 [Anneissia japonica]
MIKASEVAQCSGEDAPYWSFASHQAYIATPRTSHTQETFLLLDAYRTVKSSEESESEEESDSESESEGSFDEDDSEVLRGRQTFLEHVRADQRRENFPRPDQRWEDYRHDQRWQDYYRLCQRWEDYRRHSPRQGDYRPEMCTLKPRDIPKNLIFKGKGSWSFFKKSFMAFTEEYELSPKARIETLCWCVEGPAADFYVNLLEMDRRITFKKILKAFDKHFGEEDLPAVLQARLETATQREDESVNEWGDRVMTMTRKPYKDLPNAWIRQEAATRFCLGCRDTEAWRYVLHEQVSTLAEALTEYEQYYSLRKLYGKSGSRSRNSGKSLIKSATRVTQHSSPPYSKNEDAGSRNYRAAKCQQVSERYNRGGRSNYPRSSVPARQAAVIPASKLVTTGQKPSPSPSCNTERRLTGLEDQVDAVNRKLDAVLDMLKPRGDRCLECQEAGHCRNNCPKLVSSKQPRRVGPQEEDPLN